ncbi:hypothetical protein B0H16DRAFT_1887620 [Mycena metata]|uniref:Uncharacterized protein n=1 Tax=Mycena metata TaxID=1033252 RepID=A0AAD7IV00_9AGAR|nr:hypothetical protein B0H16DRAFT_1887620 [Mycena metata]
MPPHPIPGHSRPQKKKCTKCQAAAVMTPTSNQRIPSSMESAFAQQLEQTLSQSKYSWTLHPVYLVPSCGAGCTTCASYVDHLAHGYVGTPDAPGRTSALDAMPEQDEDQAEDEAGDSEWRPPTPRDFLLEDSDAESDAESEAAETRLAPGMHELFLLQCAHGRLTTNDLFQTDPRALGRAQDGVATRFDRLATVDRELESIRAETSAVQLEIEEYQRLHDDIQAQLAQVHKGRQGA